MYKVFLIFLSIASGVLCNTNPKPSSKPGPQYDFFDYWFESIFNNLYEDYSFENQNLTSKS